MQANDKHDRIRASLRAYEAALPAKQRKLLGQYFTGLPLGKLLAHLALNDDTHTVIDPMVGHGDLLDASWEAARERGITLERLDGIEIDEDTASLCRDRLSQIVGSGDTPKRNIVAGNAFDLGVSESLQRGGYDLVITNPPYVRYQSSNRSGQKIRGSLESIANGYLSGAAKSVWKALIEGYSGLADLSIPSWLLAGLLVRPGGQLALVVPATWRSRDYADVIRYLLLRCFTLEYIIEDTQPGWFSDALVRTHLIIARRLTTSQISTSLTQQPRLLSAEWVQMAPDAADSHSLVGAAFREKNAEAAFAVWLRSQSEDLRRGIQRRTFDLHQEWISLENQITSRRWYQRLEDSGAGLPLFTFGRSSPSISFPDAIQDIIHNENLDSLCILENAGIKIGQGLRTGCNDFFYVTVCGADNSRNSMLQVKASPAFGHHRFSVPASTLQPVLRRQSETPILRNGEIPPGRVLYLRGWVLPEDTEIVTAAASTYDATGEALPLTMPEELAAYVRLAGQTLIKRNTNVKRIPDLSAVRTNVRISDKSSITPRFWYMLPDFTPRHLPGAFVPRINSGCVWADTNFDTPILIDANFSTFWSTREMWTRFALKALLNSTWCQTLMEALGTPLGGGALKLEASHLRRMPIPRLSEVELDVLDSVVRNCDSHSTENQSIIDRIIFSAVLGKDMKEDILTNLVATMSERADKLRRERQRISS